MCGIAGVVWHQTEQPPQSVAARMAHMLHHRGPDATGTLQLQGCDLAHTRLAIVDPVGGDQPMQHSNRPLTLVFNGEIYNHHDLRTQLAQNGETCRTSSDTEVLIRMLANEGEAALNKLNGQFAFALWDDDQRHLFAARDRLGEKPFYYATDRRGRLIFASEIKAILDTGLIEPIIRRSAIDSVLGLMHTQPHETIYRDIHALPPGHTLTWAHGKVEIKRYWQPRYSYRNDITQKQAIAEVRRLLEAAIERQRLADVPIGALLSGGLDSSTIVGILAQQSSTPVHTFAAGFGDLINELPYAKAAAEHFGTEHHELQLDRLPVDELLLEMADVYDEPFADSSALPTYLICKFASQHVKAVLTGDGADELFGGYGWTRPLLLSESNRGGAAFDALRWLRWQAIRAVAKGVPAYGPSVLRAAEGFAAGRAKTKQPDAWSRRVTQATDATAEQIAQQFHPSTTLHGIDRATDFDLRVYLPGDILTKVDRAAMAHGLETRSPFLDIDLVEFVLSLPPRLRADRQRSKPLLRESCGDLWPQAIRNRGKQGFGAPVKDYLARPAVREHWLRVTAKGNCLHELFGDVHPYASSTNPQHRWRLLNLGLWLERHASQVEDGASASEWATRVHRRAAA